MPREPSQRKRPYGGRPSLKEAEQLHDRILDAASELFTKHGYAATSIESIAARAGIGKLTLYRRFEDKDALFQAVVVRMAEQRRQEIADVGESAGTLSDILTVIGQHLLDIALSPTSLAFHRIVVAEAARLPEICARIYQQDPPPDIQTPIRAIFKRFADRGVLRSDDAGFLEQQFIQAVIGAPLIRALLGAPSMTTQAQTEHVRRVINAFLHGVAKPSNATIADGDVICSGLGGFGSVSSSPERPDPTRTNETREFDR